jgi:hypothetical protein
LAAPQRHQPEGAPVGDVGGHWRRCGERSFRGNLGLFIVVWARLYMYT